MLQLADIARPRMSDQLVLRRRIEIADRFPVLAGITHEKRPRQQQNILAALAQGRQIDVNGIDTVEQVFAERASGRHPEQIAVGRRDEPAVDLHGQIAAHADDRAALQRRQQFRLQMQRQVADLIEEERTAVGDLELSGTVGARIGEGTLHVAEQFAFEQRLGHGTHIHGHHRTATAMRAAVNLARQHLLARTVFPRNEDIGIGRRDLFDDLADTFHRRTRPPEHRLVDRQFAPDLPQPFHLALRTGQLAGVAQRGDQPLIIPGLDHEIDRTVAHGPHCQIDIGIGRKENDLHVGTYVADPPQPVDALVAVVDAGREIHVEQHGVHRLAAQHGIEQFGRSQRRHLRKMTLQQQPQSTQNAAVVIHDQ